MKALTNSSDKIRVFKESLLENASYKLVALFISLILWLSILGRRDFVVTKDVEVDFTPAIGYSIAGQSTDKIRVKVSGAQPLLKNFKDKIQVATIDISDKKGGMFDIDITPSRFDVPNGIKILGVRPNTVRVEVVEIPNTQ